MRSAGAEQKKIWIDLDNSPHVPFFAPIIPELEAQGYKVCLTGRNAYQVQELAELFGLHYECFGHHWGKNMVMKIWGTGLRAVQLIWWVLKNRPDLAVAHGSRSQILVSSLMGVPSLSIYDYEHTSTSLLTPTWVLAPEIVPVAEKERHKRLSYSGIKEDVYVPSFKPDASIRERLGLRLDHIVVLMRPPASEAHYHNPLSDILFAETMKFLGAEPSVKTILLPRNARQRAAVEQDWASMIDQGKCIIPDHAEDGLNLIWHSDLVISGGGTMNREAAALGVPVYSIFRGTIGAVDRYLSETGRLTLLEEPGDLATKLRIQKRNTESGTRTASKVTLQQVVSHIIDLAERRKPVLSHRASF
jgi:predicted glycosyltransferase